VGKKNRGETRGDFLKNVPAVKGGGGESSRQRDSSFPKGKEWSRPEKVCHERERSVPVREVRGDRLEKEKGNKTSPLENILYHRGGKKKEG